MSSDSRFQITVLLAVDEDVASAELAYRGEQFADLRAADGEARVNFYDLEKRSGAVPLRGLLEALADAEHALVD